MGTYHTKIFKTKDNRQLIIRSAVPDDAEELLASLDAVLKDGEGMVLEAGESSLSSEEKKISIQKFIENQNEILLVAEIDGHIVGSLDINRGFPHRLTAVREFSRLPADKLF